MPYAYTDLGNAMVLRDLCLAENLRYSPKEDEWLQHNGTKWVRMGKSGPIMRLAQKAIALLEEAATIHPDLREQAAILKHVHYSQSEPRIRGMISLTRQLEEIVLDLDRMDSDLWAFNCANGIIDLRDGTLRPHAPDDLVMMASPVAYDPDATCPHWDQFVLDVSNDRPELVSYFQRAFGYTLTGVTTEEVMFIPYGGGCNGKSILIETVRNVMGDYAKGANAATFTSRQGGSGAREDIARLRSARFVTAVETASKDNLDSPLVKRMTSRDMITSRTLYQSSFECKPTWKIWMATNHQPDVTEVDQGLWRRLQVVPFDRTFEKVHGVEERIEAELDAEGPGILAWMVRGCLEWQRVGLAPPACIKEAVREYQEEQNPIMTFISDMCITNPHTYISISELYDTYRVWCVNTGEDNPLSKVLFGKVVKELHYRKSRKENVRYWNGITLRKAVMLSKKYLSSEPADEAGLFGEPDDDESYE